LKKWAWLPLCALLLAGCAAEPTWETVNDTIEDAATVAALGEEPYQIIFSVPMDAVLETFSQSDTRTVYTQADGEYEIEAMVLPTASIDEVVAELTGFAPDAVQTIKTERFSMPEYRFVWYSSSDEGGYLCRASVLTDAEYSYALVFSAREETGTTYRDCMNEVMDSFGLYTYEGV
jgi:hypothetical protein